MNRTKIEWADYTWNPVVGCNGMCSYCYAQKISKRQPCQQCKEFTPHLHPERLEQPLGLKRPSKIFVGSMAEMWDPDVPPSWRSMVWDIVAQAKQHTFFVLTKRPDMVSTCEAELMSELPNLWFGVSVDRRTSVWRIGQPYDRRLTNRFVSFEPLLEDLRLESWAPYSMKWVIIGGLSGDRRYHLDPNWVVPIFQACDLFDIPIFAKDNIVRHGVTKIREWPKEVTQRCSKS